MQWNSNKDHHVIWWPNETDQVWKFLFSQIIHRKGEVNLNNQHIFILLFLFVKYWKWLLIMQNKVICNQIDRRASTEGGYKLELQLMKICSVILSLTRHMNFSFIFVRLHAINFLRNIRGRKENPSRLHTYYLQPKNTKENCHE